MMKKKVLIFYLMDSFTRVLVENFVEIKRKGGSELSFIRVSRYSAITLDRSLRLILLFIKIMGNSIHYVLPFATDKHISKTSSIAAIIDLSLSLSFLKVALSQPSLSPKTSLSILHRGPRSPAIQNPTGPKTIPIPAPTLLSKPPQSYISPTAFESDTHPDKGRMKLTPMRTIHPRNVPQTSLSPSPSVTITSTQLRTCPR